jgi:5-carboxymethyl-2-hydroxymuconate isomerase
MPSGRLAFSTGVFMPHLRIDCTANLEATADMGRLCTTLVALRHDDGATLFPMADGGRSWCLIAP